MSLGKPNFEVGRGQAKFRAGGQGQGEGGLGNILGSMAKCLGNFKVDGEGVCRTRDSTRHCYHGVEEK